MGNPGTNSPRAKQQVSVTVGYISDIPVIFQTRVFDPKSCSRRNVAKLLRPLCLEMWNLTYSSFSNKQYIQYQDSGTDHQNPDWFLCQSNFFCFFVFWHPIRDTIQGKNRSRPVASSGKPLGERQLAIPPVKLLLMKLPLSDHLHKRPPKPDIKGGHLREVPLYVFPQRGMEQYQSVTCWLWTADLSSCWSSM